MHVAASCVNSEQHRWSKVKRIASKRRSVMAPTDGRTDGCTRLYTWLVLSYEKLVVNRGEPSEVNTRASAAVGADITVTAAGVGLLFARRRVPPPLGAPVCATSSSSSSSSSACLLRRFLLTVHSFKLALSPTGSSSTRRKPHEYPVSRYCFEYVNPV